MKKNYIALTLIFAILISCLPFSALAISPETITAEEFESALKLEFEKYGIEWVFEQTDPTFVYTESILEEELERAKTFGEQYLAADGDILVETSGDGINQIVSRSMPGSVTCTVLRNVIIPSGDLSQPIPATGTIENTAVVNVDFQHYLVISMYEPELRITSGTYLNPDYIVLKSCTYSTDNTSSNVTKRYVEATITCEVRLEYSVPGGTSWVNKDHTYKANFYPFA